MTSSWPTRPNRAAPSEPGALRPKDAARFLSISERHLWALTKRGEVPHLKLGRVTLYSRETLVELIRKLSAGEGGAQ
jgi:excisionase family DNA binding protein